MQWTLFQRQHHQEGKERHYGILTEDKTFIQPTIEQLAVECIMNDLELDPNKISIPKIGFIRGNSRYADIAIAQNFYDSFLETYNKFRNQLPS